MTVTVQDFELSQRHIADVIIAMESRLQQGSQLMNDIPVEASRPEPSAWPPLQPAAHIEAVTPDRVPPWNEYWHPHSHGWTRQQAAAPTARGFARVPRRLEDSEPESLVQRPTPLAEIPLRNHAVHLRYDGALSPWPDIQRRPAAWRNPDRTPRLRRFVPAGYHERLELDLDTKDPSLSSTWRLGSTAARQLAVGDIDNNHYKGVRRVKESFISHVGRFSRRTAKLAGALALMTADTAAAVSLVQQHLVH